MSPDDEILAQAQPAWLERAKQANPPDNLLTDPMRVNRELIPQVKEGVMVINSSPTGSGNGNNGGGGGNLQVRAAVFDGSVFTTETIRISGTIL